MQTDLRELRSATIIAESFERLGVAAQRAERDVENERLSSGQR